MSRENNNSTYRRIDYILSLVNQGLALEEIDLRIERADAREKVNSTNRIRGLSNEVKVARLLLNAPYVEKIERNQAWSPQDREGYDLYAYLRGIDPLDAVGVQVKSSQKGIDEFLKERGKYLGGQGDKNARNWLFNMRLVMINGSLTDDIIIQSFVGQVEEIVNRTRFELVNKQKRNT